MQTAVPNLTILQNATDSGVIEYNYLRFIRSLMISAPAALTGTITIQVTKGRAGTDWRTLQSGGADVTIAAGKAVTIDPILGERLRIHSSAAEAEDRVFDVQALTC